VTEPVTAAEKALRASEERYRTVSEMSVGFDPAAVDETRPGHLGLVSIRERAEMAGGRFRVASGEGRGTLVEAWVPNALDRASA
jgi:signal transduction histidine kinase